MSTTMERPLPVSADAERAILGVCLQKSSAVLEAASHVKREDFFHEENRLIFDACQQLAVEGKPIEAVTVMDVLAGKKKLEAAGGVAYLGSLMDGTSREASVPHYAAIIREHARRRRVIYACDALKERAFEGEESGKLLADGAGDFLSLMSQGGSDSLPVTWETASMSALDGVVEGIRTPGSVMRMNCGIPKVDELTGGFRRQDVVLLVGQTSHGKSLLAMQYAVNADDAGYRGIIFSAEMSKEALAGRELAHTANIPLYLLRRPEKIMHPDSIIRDLATAVDRERHRNLLVVDTDVTPKRIWSLCEMVHRSKGLDFVVVDYDQLVIRASIGNRDDEFKAQARFMSDALALAKRLKVAFILLCQPHKLDDDVARGKKPPRIEQIFGSSAAANTAHVVLWVMRKFFQTGMDAAHEGEASLYCLKARNDGPGKVEIGFNKYDVRFVNDPILPAVTVDTTLPKGRGRKAKEERED